jgi:hypothetical protein
MSATQETLSFIRKTGRKVVYIHNWATGYQLLEFSGHGAAASWCEPNGHKVFAVPGVQVQFNGPKLQSSTSNEDLS